MRLFIVLTAIFISGVAQATDCTPVLRSDGNYEIPTTCVEGYYKQGQKVDIEAANKRWQKNLSSEQRKSLNEQFARMDKETEERNQQENIRKLEKRIKALENK